MKKLLVIDDEEIIRRASQRTLVPAGYEVDTAASGREGLKLITENEYDLILVDLMMPEMSGREVVEQIRTITPETRILVITGYSSTETKDQVKSMGIDCYLEKPYSPKTLIEAVIRALGPEGEGCHA